MIRYINKSKYIANIEKYGADRQLTLSVINLNEIPKVNQTMVDLILSFQQQKEFDAQSAMKFLKSVALTEHYGENAEGSLGVIDIYDFTINLEKQFPNLQEEINAIRDVY